MNTKLLEQITRIVADELKNRTFRRKALTWYRPLESTIQLINLQKSRWGDYFDLNLGVWLVSLRPHYMPRSVDAHVMCRIESVPESPSKIRDALNAEDAWRMDMEQRKETLHNAFNVAEWQFFGRLLFQTGIESFLKSPSIPDLFVKKELKDHLGIKD